MKKHSMQASAALLSLLLLTFNPAKATAGVYTDDLTKCLVKSTSDQDQILLIKWIFAMFALHPAVQPLAAVTADQRDTLDKDGASLMSRLLTENCRQQAIDALKYEGISAVRDSFQVLGQVATRGLMTDPHVTDGMAKLGKYFSEDEKMKKFIKDVGVAGKHDP
jgi:hypothetical protein